MELSDRLRELRLQAGLKQEALIKYFSLSSGRYSQYETGKRKPDYELLIEFADFYGVSVDFLLGHEVHSKSTESQNTYTAQNSDERFLMTAYRKMLGHNQHALVSYAQFLQQNDQVERQKQEKQAS